MSNVTIKTTGSSDFVQWLNDFADSGLPQLQDGYTETFAVYKNSAGDSIELRGTGFEFERLFGFGPFIPTDGSVTSADLIRSEGDKVTLDGFSSISLRDIAEAAANSGGEVVDLFGNVTFNGNAGADKATLGGGDDTLIGGGGSDTLDGAAGTDTAVFGSAKASYTFAKLADGSLTVKAGGETDTLKNIEKVKFSDGTFDASTLVSTTPVNRAPVITGGEKPVTVSRAENTTKVLSFKATDADGDQLTWSVTGADSKLFTISSKGELSFKAAPDFEMPTDAGKNNVYNVMVNVTDKKLTDSQAVAVKVTNANGIDWGGNLVRPDTKRGTTEADTLRGNGGNDTLFGLGGDDHLVGGAGADKLFGGNGLIGMGNDTFVFKATSESTVAASGRDTIFDFQKGDHIDLSDIDANGKGKGSPLFTFIGEKAFSGKAGEVRFDKQASDTYIYVNTTTDKVAGKTSDQIAEMKIHLDDAITLTRGDFLFV